MSGGWLGFLIQCSSVTLGFTWMLASSGKSHPLMSAGTHIPLCTVLPPCEAAACSRLCSALASVHFTASCWTWNPGLLWYLESNYNMIVLFLDQEHFPPSWQTWSREISVIEVTRKKGHRKGEKYWRSAEEHPAGHCSANAGLEGQTGYHRHHSPCWTVYLKENITSWER